MIEDLQRIGVTLFGFEPVTIRLPELIPVFHRWIQTRAVEGLLIDVADYSHVPDGPGVLLIAHEGNYGATIEQGRITLTYLNKRPRVGSLTNRLTAVARAAFGACREIEEAPELGGRVRFRTDEVGIVANDRLLAPNTDHTLAALRPHLSELFARLYESGEPRWSRQSDPGERFAVLARVPVAADADTLLRRAAGSIEPSDAGNQRVEPS